MTVDKGHYKLIPVEVRPPYLQTDLRLRGLIERRPKDQTRSSPLQPVALDSGSAGLIAPIPTTTNWELIIRIMCLRYHRGAKVVVRKWRRVCTRVCKLCVAQFMIFRQA